MPFDPSPILMFVVLGAAFYFLLIRPQQKRAKDQQSMTNSLQPGARIMTNAGIFGTVKHVGERQVILEIAPGVEMTVVKAAVIKVLGPNDDEFEYSDEDSSEPAPVEAEDPAPQPPAEPTAPQQN